MVINRKASLLFKQKKEKNAFSFYPVGEGVLLSKKFETLVEDSIYIKTKLRFNKISFDYYKKVQNADLSSYDTDFVNLYRNGIVVFYGNEYKLSDLYIISGLKNNLNVNYLISFKNANYSILTKENIVDFVRKEIISFSLTLSFYNIYLLCKELGLYSNNSITINDKNLDNVLEIIKKSNLEKHSKVPETYYLYILFLILYVLLQIF